VLATIDFNNKPALQAYKVGNIWPDHLLPPKLKAVEFSIPQSFPENPLR
jgi:hypothetical protein